MGTPGRPRIFGIVLFAGVLLFPWADRALGWNVLGDISQVLIYMMLALGLTVVVGFGGILHLGYAAFFAVGAFSMAYLTSPQSPFSDHLVVGFWPGLMVSCLITAFVGILVAAPTLRLRGDYLAIVTMGFGLMFDPIMRNFDDATKAVTGLSAVAGPSFGNWQIGTEDRIAWYYLLLAALGVVTLLVVRIRDSRIGRSLKAMREDEIAAQSCGLDLAHLKLFAFVAGAGIAGAAGALYASFIYTLNLAFPLDFNGSIMILAMVILGGLGSVRGAMIGGLTLGVVNLVVTPKLIRLAGNIVDLSKAQYLIFGLALVGMMLLRPEGILPEKTSRIELRPEEDG